MLAPHVIQAVRERPKYPVTAASMLALTGITPTSIYPLQDTAANQALDVVATNHLHDQFSTPTYARVVKGGRTAPRQGILYDETTDRHTADVHALGTTSGIYMAAFIPSPATGAFEGVIGRVSAGAAEGAYAYMQNAAGYVWFVVADSGVNQLTLSDPTINIRSPYEPVLGIFQIDRANSVARMRLSQRRRLVSEVSGSIAGFATLDGASQVFGLGGYLTGVSIVGGTTALWAAVATGVQCEGATVPATIARGLRWER